MRKGFIKPPQLDVQVTLLCLLEEKRDARNTLFQAIYRIQKFVSDMAKKQSISSISH